ncbi:MAG: hypothetical protein JJ899_05815 [Alphaproteobacteria bacterium]|nr:hypothetical protein [Alphaproteobacteria bacterium]
MLLERATGLFYDNWGGAHTSEWDRDAKNMFPNSDSPAWDYQQFLDQRSAEQRRWLLSAIPEDIRPMVSTVQEVPYGSSDYGRLGFDPTRGTLYMIPTGAVDGIFLYAADTNGNNFADTREIASALDGKMSEIREHAAERATRLRDLADEHRARADQHEADGNAWSAGVERRRAEAYDEMLKDYRGPFVRRDPAPRAPGGGGGTGPGGPVIDAADTTLADLSLGGITGSSVSDPSGEQPGAGLDIGVTPLVETSRGFSGSEAQIDVDIVNRGDPADLVAVAADTGLAIAGIVNVAVGVTVSTGKGFKQTFDYAVNKGLGYHQAIFAGLIGGSIDGVEAFAVDRIGGQIAARADDLAAGLRAGRDVADSSGVVGTATSLGIGSTVTATGARVADGVGKRLVDGMAASKDVMIDRSRTSYVDSTDSANFQYAGFGAGFGRDLNR